MKFSLTLVIVLSVCCLTSQAVSAQGTTFSVTLDPIKNGSIRIVPPLPADGAVAAGTVLSVTAKANEGYAVDSIYFSVPGRWGAMYHESLTPEFQIEIDQDKHVGASFVETGQIEHIDMTHNVVYAQPGIKPLKYDVYSPHNASDLPIIVIIHGGGWTTNDEDIMRALARELTKGGKFVVCSVDYRWVGTLDGDEEPNTMANLIEDVFGAIAHIMEHAGDYGGDPTRIGVTGDSAGGHLSAAAAILIEKIGDRGFAIQENIYEFKPTYIPQGKSTDQVRDEMLAGIRAAAPSYGVFSPTGLRRFVWNMSDSAADAVAPQSHVPSASDRKTPQYMVRGTKDSLITDDAVSAFAESLESQGQTVVYDQVEGAGHAFFDWKPNDDAKATFEEFGVPYAAKMREFFEQHLLAD